MTTEKINAGLIEIMREKVPAGTNMARMLMDLLCIGKEAVYRRLRGEVPFTLAEAAIVSGKLGISLDKLVASGSSGNAIFDINIIDFEDPVETYCSMVDHYVNMFRSMNCYDDSVLGTSSNRLPHVFTMNYETLSRFRLSKWLYQNQSNKHEAVRNYEFMELPDKLYRKFKEYVTESHNFSQAFLVWDSTIFKSLVDEITYFRSIDMVSADMVHKIKEELMAMIEDMYIIATNGMYRNGHEVQIYVSNINFEATYSYAEARNMCVSMLRIFSVNSLSSKDPNVFNNLKGWINSLKKFSILISQSGEMQRIQFFNKQRDIVSAL